MKQLILFELILLFLATTFIGDNPPGWFQQTLPRSDVTIQDIFFIDSLTGYVVVRKNTLDSAFIYKTTDGGNNWTTSLGENIYLTSIQFVDINTGYSVGSRTPGIVKKTTNGGVSWFTASLLTAYPLLDVNFVNNSTGWICSNDLFDGGVFKTTNGGINWQRQLNETYLPTRLFFLNSDTGWAVCNSTKLYRTINGGTNWNLQFTFSAGAANIFFINKDTGFVAGGFGSHSIKRTTSGGFSWDSTTNSQGGRGLFFINKTIGWNSDVFSIVQKTTDGGLHWFRQTVPSGFYYTIQFADTLRGWAGGTILIHTTDGGGPPVGIKQISNEIPKEFKLFQNYPNPFNPVTKIKYSLPRPSKGGENNAKLILYDIQGKEIQVLVNQTQNAGTYQIEFDGTDYSSGIYIYSLFVNDKLTESRKMILIK